MCHRACAVFCWGLVKKGQKLRKKYIFAKIFAYVNKKLYFCAVILAGLMKQEINYVSLFFVGLGVVVIFAFLGFRLIARSKKKK